MRTRPGIAQLASLVGFALCAGAFGRPTPVAGQTEAVLTNQASTEAEQVRHAPNSLLSGVSLTTRMRSSSVNVGNGNHPMEGYLMGHLTLRRFTDRSGLVLDYEGGNSVSSGPGGGRAPVHALEFSQTASGQRWTVSISGSASYLPESSFGLGWSAGFSSPSVTGQNPDASAGAATTNLNTPADQTILTTRVRRLSSALSTQLQYRTSPRSSWTASGSYGRLDFKDSGYVDSSSAQAQAGYAYRVNRRDTATIAYGFDGLRFAQTSLAIDEHRLSISFSRQVSSKLSLQASAGPSVSTFRSPLAGAANQVSYRIESGFNYTAERGSMGLSYDRLLTAGSGVLVGAQTNQLQLTAVRVLTQSWQAATALGYAVNRGFVQFGASATQAPVRYWYSSTKVSRRLNGGSLFWGYSVRSQSSSGAVCAAGGCGQSFTTHEFSVGLSWSFLPINL